MNQARQFGNQDFTGSSSPSNALNHYAPYEQEIIENYGQHYGEKKYTFHEGECFLKTKSDRYK